MRREQLVENSFGFYAAISACLKASTWNIALDLLSSMRHENMQNNSNYNTAISACENASVWTFALDPLSCMRREVMEHDSNEEKSEIAPEQHTALDMLHVEASGDYVSDDVCTFASDLQELKAMTASLLAELREPL